MCPRREGGGGRGGGGGGGGGDIKKQLREWPMPQHTGSKIAPGTALQVSAHSSESFPKAHLQRTVSPSISCTGILIVPMHPACRLTTGVVVVTGEELIRPLSALGDRFPLTLISQLPPLETKFLQQQPENLQQSHNRKLQACCAYNQFLTMLQSW